MTTIEIHDIINLRKSYRCRNTVNVFYIWRGKEEAIWQAMNKELSAQGYITMAGRIPKAFWAKKMYGYEIAEN